MNVMERASMPVRMDQSDAALWELYRSTRSSYQQICLLLVERGIIAELPKDLDKPIKI